MMHFREAVEADAAGWNEFLCRSPNGNLRQSTFWGRIKAMSGWEPHYYLVEAGGEIKALALVQGRSIPATPWNLLYCCRGPVVDWRDGEACRILFTGLKKVLRERRGFLLRIDPEPVPDGTGQEQVLLGSGLVGIPDRCTSWNRTLYTARVALDLDEEGLFMRMRRTHRQNINRAIREGVTTSHEPSPDDPEQFALLMKGLESRRNSVLHPPEYYEEILHNLVDGGNGFFLKARLDGRVISGLVVGVLGDKAWAVFMANDYRYRKLMPNKVLLWEAVRLGRQLGCRFVDLGASQGSNDFDPYNDPLDNLKDAYHPEVIRYPGYFDLPSRLYPVFRVTEDRLLPAMVRWYVKAQRFMHRGSIGEAVEEGT